MSSSQTILFDGVCNLCNGAVSFIIAHDPAGRFRFASMQSEAGSELLKQAGIVGDALDTLVLIDEGRVRVRSDAVLAIASGLSGAWPVLGMLRVVPGSLRDLVYRVVARNRYRVFGRRNECMLPTPELRARFLSDG